MAVITTTLTPVLTFFPWNDDSEIVAPPIQPVGELMANSRDEAVTLSGSGDSQECRWQLILPANFSYVLTDVSASMTIVAGTNTWSPEQNLMFQDTTAQANQTFEFSIGLTSLGVARHPGSVNQLRTWRPFLDLPKFQQRGDSIWQITLVNNNLEEDAGVANITMRFLQYKLTQQFDSAVNTPVLVR